MQLLLETANLSVARINRHADAEVSHQTL